VSAPAPGLTRVATWSTLAVGSLSRRLGLGSGSVVGGRVGLALDPELLERLGRGRTAALVTGTNGKTTTSRLLVAALGGPGRVAANAAGSNLPAGLAAALAAAPDVPAVLEVDEGYLGRAVAALAPDVVVLLNLSRDQLDRVSEVRMVAERFRTGLSSFGGTVVANADDPLVAWAAGAAAKVVWVGAGTLWRSDAVGCPACDGPVVFDDSGTGWSSGCGFERPEPAWSLGGDEMVSGDGRRLALHLTLPGRFNRANAAMALAAAEVLGVDPHLALSAMAAVGDVEGRYASVQYGTTQARLLLAKNPAGWAELLDLLEGGEAPVVVGINARVADGHDPSWLWDVDFERLAGRRVVATGERAADLAVRLRYGGVAHVAVANQLEALGASGAPSVEYVGNYTAFQDLRRALARADDAAVVHRLRPFQAPMAVPVARAVPSEEGDQHAARRRRRRHDGVSALRVVVVHPDLLGTYGDGGNGRVLAARAAWRGTAAELLLAFSGRALPGSGDLYLLGGGEDGPELQAAGKLRESPLGRAVAMGGVVLGVCAGYQLLGERFPDASGAARAGLGLLDVSTVKGSGRRAVGELLAEPLASPLFGPRPEPLTGFENHSGHTRLGTGAAPLAAVRAGVGNGNGTEGAWSGNVFGTYLHGPALARNPAFADLLLARATGEDLVPLDDSEERALRAERLAAAVGAGRRWWNVSIRRLGLA
jgi:lipid II isoglutaminyl synthase (glutamine-hydrolysing)